MWITTYVYVWTNAEWCHTCILYKNMHQQIVSNGFGRHNFNALTWHDVCLVLVSVLLNDSGKTATLWSKQLNKELRSRFRCEFCEIMFSCCHLIQPVLSFSVWGRLKMRHDRGMVPEFVGSPGSLNLPQSTPLTRQDLRNELGGNGNQSTRASWANHVEQPGRTGEPSLSHCITPSSSLSCPCITSVSSCHAHCSSFSWRHSTVTFSLCCAFFHW